MVSSLAELEDELLDELPSARTTRASTKLGTDAQDTKQASKSDVDEEDTFMIRKSRVVRCAAPAAVQGGRSFGSTTVNAPSSSGHHGHHGLAAPAKKTRKNQGGCRKFSKEVQGAGSGLGSVAFSGAPSAKGASSLQQQTISSFCLPRGSSQSSSKKTPSTEPCPVGSGEPEETQLQVRLCDPPYGASSFEQHTAQRSARGLMMAESGNLPCSSSGGGKASEEPLLQGTCHAKEAQGKEPGMGGEGGRQQQQEEEKGKAPLPLVREGGRPEQRRVTFAPGPLRDIYGTEDGHPDREGRTARPAPSTSTASLGGTSSTASSSSAAAASAPFTAANLEALRVMLGPDCRPSLERLERRLAATASSSGLGARAARSRAARAPPPPSQSTAPPSPSERINLPSSSDTSAEQGESKEAQQQQQQQQQQEDVHGASNSRKRKSQGEGGKEEDGEQEDPEGCRGQSIGKAAQATAPER